MAAVTAVERIKKRWRVTLDGSSRIWLTNSLMRERPLAVGDEIDPDEYDQWLMLRQYRYALQKAVEMLAARPHSSGEITQRLLRCGYRPCTAEMVVYKLQTLNLLDDAEFARLWAESRQGHRYGTRRIAQELRRKGVDVEDIAAALEALDAEENEENALVLARKAVARAKTGEERRKTFSRAAAALARRGYDYDTARRAVLQAMQETDDADFEE